MSTAIPRLILEWKVWVPSSSRNELLTTGYSCRASMTAREMKGRYVSENPSRRLNSSLWARRTRSTRS